MMLLWRVMKWARERTIWMFLTHLYRSERGLVTAYCAEIYRACSPSTPDLYIMTKKKSELVFATSEILLMKFVFYTSWSRLSSQSCTRHDNVPALFLKDYVPAMIYAGATHQTPCSSMSLLVATWPCSTMFRVRVSSRRETGQNSGSSSHLKVLATPCLKGTKSCPHGRMFPRVLNY